MLWRNNNFLNLFHKIKIIFYIIVNCPAIFEIIFVTNLLTLYVGELMHKGLSNLGNPCNFGATKISVSFLERQADILTVKYHGSWLSNTVSHGYIEI